MRHLAMIIWLALLTVFPSLGPPVVSQTTPYPANVTREPANMTMAPTTRELANITMATTARGQLLLNMTTIPPNSIGTPSPATPLRPRFKCYETNCTQGVAECQVVCKDSFMGLPVVPDRCTTARCINLRSNNASIEQRHSLGGLGCYRTDGIQVITFISFDRRPIEFIIMHKG
ncbi:uncharacterized protein LOC5502288 isoform X2 [Nematostella vectensis]|uniref:uncharacterized protein LOC5502288 isoform X2 n=1 Tax=Nematostella vectensis TaxID=45351 RepID=UPI002077124B|nr:uncharacterized protein LOC5502288 isoform X2 [Nematostella vectensis]